jgi:hypothetical protein
MAEAINICVLDVSVYATFYGPLAVSLPWLEKQNISDCAKRLCMLGPEYLSHSLTLVFNLKTAAQNEEKVQ